MVLLRRRGRGLCWFEEDVASYDEEKKKTKRKKLLLGAAVDSSGVAAAAGAPTKDQRDDWESPAALSAERIEVTVAVVVVEP